MGGTPTKPLDPEKVDDFLKQIRPLDLIVFRGAEGVSNLIRKLEGAELGDDSISHVEIAISAQWCWKIRDFKNYKKKTSGIGPDTLFSWGSTLGGPLNDGVYDAETGKTVFGVQIRNLKELVTKYASNPNANVGVCRLINNPLYPDGKSPLVALSPKEIKAFQKKINTAYQVYHDAKYNYNPLDLAAALFPKLRKFRDKIPDQGKVFCSEFAAQIYLDLGIIDDLTDGVKDGIVSVDPENVVPVDFVLDDNQDDIKVRICHDPIWIRD